MKNIQMVDLKSQYLNIKEEIDSAIQNVIDNTAFINGPDVDKFAIDLAEYLGVNYVIPCANGTDALQIALMALGLKPGDEVITPSFTYIATVEVVALLGLTPVFVDVDYENFNILPQAIEAAITEKTKAIIPVHLYGQSAPMEEILSIAKKYNIPIVEDNAQGIGGSYQFSDGHFVKNGAMGTIGCTSFFPSKNLGCYGDGGALFTNDEALASKIKMIANHGQKVKYQHDIVGCNSRLDTIQAAILDVKLKYLDDYCKSRRSVAKYYDDAFHNHPLINTPKNEDYTYHVFHQYTLKIDSIINRNELANRLKERGIPTMIYYPKAAHQQGMFQDLNAKVMDLTNTEKLNPIVLSLPIHTEMKEQELEYITTNFLSIIDEMNS